jgi:hypothetical protein
MKVLGLNAMDTIPFKESIQNVDYHQDCLYTAYHSLLSDMFPNMPFGLFVFSDTVIIHTPKFGLKISNNNGAIEKQYTSNSYECIIAEQELSKVCMELIDWVRKKPASSPMLVNILFNLLSINYHPIVCFKKHGNHLSTIHFTGIFNNVYCIENLMINGKTIQTSKRCLSKEKAAQYIVDRGYYVYVTDNVYPEKIEDLENVYTPHIVSAVDSMKPVTTLVQINMEEVKDIVLNRYISREKLNDTITITPLKDVPDMSYYIRDGKGKNYWSAIQ